MTVVQNNLVQFENIVDFSFAFGQDLTSACSQFIERLVHSKTAEYLYVDYKNELLLLSGYKRNDELLITSIVLHPNNLLNELTKMNSESKDRIKTLEKKVDDNSSAVNHDVLNEIMRLNKALENAQQEIKNVNVTLDSKVEELNRLAIHDNLTGLYNRLYLQSKFNEIYAFQRRLQHDVTMVMIDLNDFRMVNEAFGHDEGDRLLVKFSEVGQNITRKDFDFLFRIGGDEFLIIMVECSAEKAHEVCKRLNENFRKHTVVSSLSYGIVALDAEDDETLAYYLAESENRMYAFKEVYKNQDQNEESN